jgi:hypothetical protein
MIPDHGEIPGGCRRNGTWGISAHKIHDSPHLLLLKFWVLNICYKVVRRKAMRYSEISPWQGWGKECRDIS